MINMLCKLKKSSMTVSSNHDSSYPPLFRPYHGVDQVEPTPIHDSDDSVPVIDLQCLNQEGKCKLNEACKNWGIFRVVNHGIPMTLLNQLHDSAKEIFSLPFESKESQSLCSSMPYFWGTLALTPHGVPIDRGPNALKMNWVEGFHAPLGVLSQFQAQHPMADTFRFLLEEYGKHQCRVATTIFKAMAENLKLDPEQSKPYLSTSDSYIRIYRYPHCSQADQAWGIGVHTDSSVLSILMNQDEVGGLQVLNQHDKWVDVKPHSNSLIVNLGDMMKAMSDDKYKSVMHRVKISKYKDRMSFGYFVFPVDDGVIWSTKYKPFTYADFRAQVQQDLKTVGYKVGLDRFRITDP